MTTDEDDNYQKESLISASPSSSQQTKDTTNVRDLLSVVVIYDKQDLI